MGLNVAIVEICYHPAMRRLALIFLLFPTIAFAEVAGIARVIDGDTFDIADQRIRLHGIDTPESKQTCQRDSVTWSCGAEATKTLRDLISGSTVNCVERDRDRYGRMVAVCHAGKVNLNAEIVRLGMALAYRRYSNDYVGQEASAKAARRGLWGGRFVPPWEWRRGKRLVTSAANDNNCRIKGNISSKGERIYHMPGGRWYYRTVIAPSKGERWFCTEEDAKAEGWRRAGSTAYEASPSATPAVTGTCCKVCRKGKACGNSCISRRYTCRRPKGCACNR